MGLELRHWIPPSEEVFLDSSANDASYCPVFLLFLGLDLGLDPGGGGLGVDFFLLGCLKCLFVGKRKASLDHAGSHDGHY